MHRSGTSAVTRTLNLMAAAPDNAAGFWESADIMAVHDRFLAAIGSAWDDPRPLPLAAFATVAATALSRRPAGHPPP